MVSTARTALHREIERLRAVEERIRRIKLREAERLLAIAEEAGWFEVEVSDGRLAEAFARLVREAGGEREARPSPPHPGNPPEDAVRG